MDETTGRILIVEDDQSAQRLLTRLLEQEGYTVAGVESGEEGLRSLKEQLFDVVLLDLNLPGMHGMNVLSAIPAVQTDAEFVMMTGVASVKSAVKAMRLGAFDYLTKPLEADELMLVVERALRSVETRRELARLRRESDDGVRSRIVGKSGAIERLFDQIERVAPTQASVLISGETGTGKELVARAIHDLSPRARKPFVPVNCSAMPDSLLESELFGFIKGSFTGADSDRRGLIEEAHGGTLFLDEAATLAGSTQVKLLRVLQERTVQRIGARTPVGVNFRMVAATNEDLAEKVREDEFREDLFYRLNVFPLRVPPLRERKSDIPLLAHHFRSQFADENEMEVPGITSSTIDRMMEYDWPGNVRELENFIYRSMIQYAGADSIRFDADALQGDSSAAWSMVDEGADRGWDLDRLEREYIFRVLEKTDGNQTRAAEQLGIDRRTLYRKLKKYEEEGVTVPASS